ncbi:putative fasciclin-like arabinogalactan protein 20 [Diospyros lotus]|uniref:putative fasciclin-like arabinogalactan protein 20 n=1 Tax=Diospyros lotus TaxID=55363 RepID=UPI00225A60F5|nr:putative fasciclin-like arabinogalactan protein 20 [Diospyros lotus]
MNSFSGVAIEAGIWLGGKSDTVLVDLGFQDFAPAAPSLPSQTAWRGLITVFTPTDSSLLTCPSCSIQVLLQEHTIPGIFPPSYLRTLAFGTKIETLASGRCITVTSANNASKVFVDGVEITHPDLFNDGLTVVHGLQGFLSLLSSYSCSVERMIGISFLPQPPNSTASLIMHLMLEEAILRLRISGYSVLAVALRVKYAELMELRTMTVFALNDVVVFSGEHEYVTNFRFHVVPNRLLMANDLEHLQAGTLLPTMDLAHDLVVTNAGGGGPLDPMRINYVKFTSPDLMYNMKMAVHGLSMPFPHLNLIAAIGMAQSERSRHEAPGWKMAGNAGIGYSMGPSYGLEWTAKIEDDHSL